ncbi:MAG: hypothetical protein KDE22_07485 [Rhodobacterales bacterium]|nr:hypothetical protein [Rhodobacterales bacterium]
MARIFAVLPACVVSAGLLCAAFAAAPARAEESTFLGQAITVEPGRHLVLKDVNLRGAPRTGAPRVGRLEKGTVVDSPGFAAKGGWLAVTGDGFDPGFIFAPVTVPLIDGTLDEDLAGVARAANKGPGSNRACAYRIRWTGRSPIPDEVITTADYDVSFHCRDKAKSAPGGGPSGAEGTATGYMFLTEAPYNLSRRRVYQITIDLIDITGDYEEVLSVTTLYQAHRDEVLFDSRHMKTFADKPTQRTRPAASVPEALRAAVELAVESWTDAAWAVLTAPGGAAAYDPAPPPGAAAEEEPDEDGAAGNGAEAAPETAAGTGDATPATDGAPLAPK